MTRIIVLGSTGMLGSAVVQEANRQNLTCIEVSRDTGFNYPENDLAETMIRLEICETDWVVNCIGWIPQKSMGNFQQDENDAYLLNVKIIEQISHLQESLGFNWIQILTDCVYSGGLGGYTESSPKDAQDLYGKTKAAGEAFTEKAIQIRCSIVGKDSRSDKGLFEWFRKQASKNYDIVGYTNRYWNGVSAKAFAKLCVGLANTGTFKPVRQHWIPANSVTKFELLQIFAKNLNLPGIGIKPGQGIRKNLILGTENEEMNQKLWLIAGYSGPPTIEFLCEEFILNGSEVP